MVTESRKLAVSLLLQGKRVGYMAKSDDLFGYSRLKSDF